MDLLIHCQLVYCSVSRIPDDPVMDVYDVMKLKSVSDYHKMLREQDAIKNSSMVNT